MADPSVTTLKAIDIIARRKRHFGLGQVLPRGALGQRVSQDPERGRTLCGIIARCLRIAGMVAFISMPSEPEKKVNLKIKNV
jgi:hypothetical protein